MPNNPRMRMLRWLVPPVLTVVLSLIMHIFSAFSAMEVTFRSIVVLPLILCWGFFELTWVLLRRWPTSLWGPLGIPQGVAMVIYIPLNYLQNQQPNCQGCNPLSHLQLLGNASLVLVVSLFALFTFRLLRNYRALQESELQRARLQKEQYQARWQGLQQQLQPHFLFNAFHTLDGLIAQDPARASAYLHELAELYRKLLKVQTEEVVPLSEDWALAQHYLRIMQTRFGAAFRVAENLGESGHSVASLTLLPLLENIFKHNQLDTENPLPITIEVAGNTLTVKNPQRPRTQASPATGTGLANLQARYQHLTEGTQTVQVLEENGHFVVQIPLLQVDAYPDSGR